MKNSLRNSSNKKNRLTNKTLLKKKKNSSSKPQLRKQQYQSLKKYPNNGKKKRNLSYKISNRNKYGQFSAGLKKKKKKLLLQKGFRINQTNIKNLMHTTKSKESKESYMMKNFLKKNKKMMNSLKENRLKIDYLSRKQMLNQCLKEYLKNESDELYQDQLKSLREAHKIKANQTARDNLHVSRPYQKRNIKYRSANQKNNSRKINNSKSKPTLQPHFSAKHLILSGNPIFSTNESNFYPIFDSSQKEKNFQMKHKQQLKKIVNSGGLKANLMDMSPFNIHFKKIKFGPSSTNSELKFDNLLALSFQDSKKLKAVHQIETILKGEQQKSETKDLGFTENPVEKNLKLKIKLNQEMERLKSLKTQNFYSRKHLGKLSALSKR